MKYSDPQRIQKIYEKSVELYNYIVGHQIKKELLNKLIAEQVQTYNIYFSGHF